MIIAIDFDGTCVTHEFPKVGRDIGAERVLKALTENGHDLILFTMRSNAKVVKASPEFPKELGGAYLTDAINWFKEKDIPLFGIQVNPTQGEWTSSPKCYAQLYIDDAALGIPLINDGFDTRDYVDWEEVEHMLISKGILP
jgi:hypothetical protein